MSYDAEVYKVFIASPGDVLQERQIVRDVIQQWNCNNSEDKDIILQPVGWETHSFPSAGKSAQQLINDQCVNDCDLCIGIFWTKLGTPTDSHISGTVEEIEYFIKTGKPAMIYFSDKSPASLNDVDLESYAKVKAYRTEFENNHKGLYAAFSNQHNFRENLSNHLQLMVNREFGENISQKEIATSSRILQLSDKAKELLLEASEGSGQIGSLFSQGHDLLEVINGKEFVFPDCNLSVREITEWKDSLQSLIKTGLIRSQNPQNTAFEITLKGFEYADKLKSEKKCIRLNKQEEDIYCKALKEDSGEITCITAAENSMDIQVGISRLEIPQNHKNISLYQNALRKLVKYGFICYFSSESSGPIEVYKVTKKGYEFGADNNLL
ncbi:MAG: DUF4062 domain-containing protein [Victivallales bacterium]|nr:DUF4062 domain-containing protein [Victivallales bacterium]